MITTLRVIGVVYATWCFGAAGFLACWLAVGWVRRTRAELQSWDATEEQVLDFANTLTGELVDSTGTVVVPAPVNPTPELIARAERAGQFAEVLTLVLTTLERRYYGVGRHRAVGMDAIRPAVSQALEGATTGAFRVQIRREFGAELQTVGPREADLRPTVWAQPELLEVVP